MCSQLVWAHFKLGGWQSFWGSFALCKSKRQIIKQDLGCTRIILCRRILWLSLTVVVDNFQLSRISIHRIPTRKNHLLILSSVFFNETWHIQKDWNPAIRNMSIIREKPGRQLRAMCAHIVAAEGYKSGSHGSTIWALVLWTERSFEG